MYLSILQEKKKKMENLQETIHYPGFGSFDDVDKYNGFFPSTHYMQTVWYAYFFDLVHDIGDERWAGDGSHKLAGLVATRSKVQSSTWNFIVLTNVIKGFYTIVNEFGEIVLSKPMKTGSLKEIKSDLRQIILKCYIGYGFALPHMFYTDQ